MAKKERADKLLVQRNLVKSREEARRLIMAGLVFLDNKRIEKAGELIPLEKEIFIKQKLHNYVGRGGLKLEKALKEFKIDVKGRVCADIGSSTGGFTDCLLQNGAKLVYAIDTGTNQLDLKLRKDSRVVVMENFNARYLKREDLDFPVSFICMDVSFISVKKIIPVFSSIIDEGKDFDAVILIKPQFEVGKDEVEKKGIIKDRTKHIRVIEDIISFSELNGFCANNLTKSPIQGQKGNIEYLLHLKVKGNCSNIVDKERIKEVVYNEI